MAHPLVQPDDEWMRHTISDGEVVRRVVAGEAELFELLVRRYNQRLYRTIRAHVLDDDEALETLQRAYVSAWRGLAGFERRSSFATWITRIALRTANALVEGRLRRQDVEAAAAQTELYTGESADREAERAEMTELVEASVDRLPEGQRVVFVLRMIEGLSTEDTANSLGLSEAAVKVRLHRAREILKADLLSRAEELGALTAAWRFDGARCDRVTAWTMAAIAV